MQECSLNTPVSSFLTSQFTIKDEKGGKEWFKGEKNKSPDQIHLEEDKYFIN